jgi:hypothetical protein
MKETLAALLVGTLIAAAVSCGGTKSPKSVASPGAMPADSGSVVPGSPRDQIKALDDQITAELAQLGVSAPTPASTCPQEPCPTPTAQTVKVKPSDDPTCKRSEAQVCKDHCVLADSICGNAKSICDIANSLANDAWANEKCTSGNASCEAAHDKCCGCT